MGIVLTNCRLADPEAGTETVGDLRVADGRIAALGADVVAADGDTVVDCSGLVVGPGFVDLHSHAYSLAGHRLQAMDGVTTSLELEAGMLPVAAAYARAAEEGRPLNFGFSASWGLARARVLIDHRPDGAFGSTLDVLGNTRWQRSSTRDELTAWLRLLEGELAAGALGIGVLMGYAPRTDPAEYLEVARVAAAANAPTWTHVRAIAETDPDVPIDGSFELARAAGETGAAMHHCHVNSTSLRHIRRVMADLTRRRAEGSRITIEAYPYGAGSTAIGAFFLDPDRLHLWGIEASDIVLVETGERMADAARLAEVRRTQPAAKCIIHYLREDERPEDLRLLTHALESPDSIVASDAMPVSMPDGTTESDQWPLPAGASTHPRTAGTFSRALRLMVREAGVWSWPEAFRRCSLLPAMVLAEVAPDAARKGRLAVGMDADLVVLDPERLTDRATYAEPTLTSDGIDHVLVGGEWVVRAGELQLGARPGRALRGGVSSHPVGTMVP